MLISDCSSDGCSSDLAALAQAPGGADAVNAMLRELAAAAGSHGMCGGQALDIDATGSVSPLGVEELERLHALKTGALLRASVRLGAIAAGVDAEIGRAHV